MNGMVHYSPRHEETKMAASSETRPATPAARHRWPGPRGNFLFGCLRAFRRDQLNFLREVWRTHGDHVRIPTVPGYDIYFLSDPAAIEHVLVKNHKNYRKPGFLTGPVRLLLG